MKNIKRILVPVDYSPTSGVALEAALSLAHTFQAAVEVLHCWTGVGYVDGSLPNDVHKLIADQARAEMKSFIELVEAPEGVELTSRVQHGIAWQIVTEMSAEYDLIVMGTAGRTGFKRLMLGSVASRVVQGAACPVMTIRHPESLELPEKKEKVPQEEQIVHAMFDDKQHIAKAFTVLQDAGLSMEDVSLVMTEDTHDADFRELDKTKAVKGATAGGIMGGTIGGILGGLISMGTVVTGGIGLVVMGPALAFAAAGGLFGGLLGRTVPDDKAMVLKAQLTEGRTLMAVHIKDPSKVRPVQEIITACEGELLEL